MHIQHLISDRAQAAFVAAGLPADTPTAVKPSTRADFGDYQINGVMGAAKALRMNPRELAGKVVEALNLGDIASKVEIAGPGFINIHLSPAFLASALKRVQGDLRLCVEPQPTQTIVIDYSAPNVAKEMAVHHIRSTVIGDAAVRVLSFLGHKVIRANHIGDWGTQFGMLIAHLEELQRETPDVMEAELKDLEEFYRHAKKRYDSDEAFAEQARGYVVKLQSGDAWCLAMWKKLVEVTMTQNQQTYRRLNVLLTADDTMGESLYNPMLAEIVADLEAKGLAVESEGAKVVFLDEYKNKDGEPMGVIVQKRDGGYLYTTTDIACAKYRVETLGADRVLYYIDSRQAQHLQQAWTIARKAGYVPERVSLEHHAFGMMLGRDGKPFKTRSGGVVKLSELLDEAEERATALIKSKDPELSGDELAEVAHKVAMGAVKYADLSKHRATDYVFDWDLMLSFEGNTAPYMQYAYTRVRSIFRRADIDTATLQGDIEITSPHEKALAVKLLQLEECLLSVAGEGTPHQLCNYLFELAGLFMSFYEHCPILKDDVPKAQRESRLLLADITARTLATGLDLLGIEVMERM